MAEHTPLPWRVAGPIIATPDDTICIAGKIDGDPYDVAYVPLSDCHDADAEYIVRAVNAFPALLEACEAVMAAGGEQYFDKEVEAFKLVAAAVAAAEGKDATGSMEPTNG